MVTLAEFFGADGREPWPWFNAWSSCIVTRILGIAGDAGVSGGDKSGDGWSICGSGVAWSALFVRKYVMSGGYISARLTAFLPAHH